MPVRPAQHDGASGLACGATFAGYRVEAVVGEGRVGVVYRATQLALGRPVALKHVVGELAEHPPFRKRLERETPLAASIRHPGIVPVYEILDADDGLVLAMRYVAGTDLAAVIEREGALEARRAVLIGEQVAAALDAAHRRGLVHRDVKPAHVLLGDDDGAYACLTDFGVSTLGASSLGYLAPEQLRDEPAGVRSDVYALGCLLFHAVAGRAPFERSTELATIAAHLESPAPTLSAARADAPPALDAVVARALSKRPADRYASAGELAAAAADALHGRATTRRRRTPAGAPLPRNPAIPSRTPLARRSWLVARAVLAAVIVGCLPAAALVAAGVINGGGDEPQAAPPGPRQAAVTPEHRRAAPTRVASIRVGKGADGIAVAGGDVWVAAPRDDALVRVDARTNRVSARVRAGVDPDSVAASRDTVWVTSRGDGLLRRFTTRGDPAPAGTVPVGGKPEGIALDHRSAWVLSSADDTVTRIDRASAAPAARATRVGDQPIEIVAGPSGVWTTNSAEGTVSHISAATGRTIGQPIRVGGQPKGIAEGLGSVWVANGADDTVSRIDPRTGRVTGEPIRVGDEPSKITVGAGLVWVTNFGAGTVTRIDPRTARTVGAPTPVGRRPVGIAYGAGHIWVASLSDGTVTKLRP